MSEYLDQTPRTEEEALADIRKNQAKLLLALTNKVINLCRQLQTDLNKTG